MVRLVTALDSALPLDGVQVLALVRGLAVTFLDIMHEAERIALGRQEKYLSTIATLTTDYQQRLQRILATVPGSGRGGDFPCCQ